MLQREAGPFLIEKSLNIKGLVKNGFPSCILISESVKCRRRLSLDKRHLDRNIIGAI